MRQKVWPHQNVTFRGPTVPAACATVPGHPGSLENFGSSPSTRQRVWPFTHSYTAIEKHGPVPHGPPECWAGFGCYGACVQWGNRLRDGPKGHRCMEQPRPVLTETPGGALTASRRTLLFI